MSLTETYSRVQVGKNVSDRFPIRNGLKKGNPLSPMIFNIALDYTIRRVEVNQGGCGEGTLKYVVEGGGERLF